MIEVKIQQILWAHVKGWGVGHCGLGDLTTSLGEANRIWRQCCIAFANKEQPAEKSVDDTKATVTHTGWYDMELFPRSGLAGLNIAKQSIDGAIPAHYICGFKNKTEIDEVPRVARVETRRVHYGQASLSPPLVVLSCHDWRLNALAHELGHLLLQKPDHVNLPENLMQEGSEHAGLTPAQCKVARKNAKALFGGAAPRAD